MSQATSARILIQGSSPQKNSCNGPDAMGVGSRGEVSASAGHFSKQNRVACL